MSSSSAPVLEADTTNHDPEPIELSADDWEILDSNAAKEDSSGVSASVQGVKRETTLRSPLRGVGLGITQRRDARVRFTSLESEISHDNDERLREDDRVETSEDALRKARANYGQAGYRDPTLAMICTGMVLVLVGCLVLAVPEWYLTTVYVDADAYGDIGFEIVAPACVLRKTAAILISIGLYAMYASNALVVPLRALVGYRLAPTPLTPARQTQACGHVALALILPALTNALVIGFHFRRTGSGGLDVRIFNEAGMGAEAMIFVMLAAVLAQYAEQLPKRVEVGRMRVRTPAGNDSLLTIYRVAMWLGAISGFVYMIRPKWIVTSQLSEYEEPHAMQAAMDGFDVRTYSAFGLVTPKGKFVEALPREAQASAPGEALAAFRRLYPGKAAIQTASMLAMDIGARRLGALLVAEAYLLLDMYSETSFAHVYTTHIFVTLRALISTVASFHAQASGHFTSTHISDGVTCLFFFVVYVLVGRWTPSAWRQHGE